MESQPKPPFVTGILSGGKTEGIAYNNGVLGIFMGGSGGCCFFNMFFCVKEIRCFWRSGGFLSVFS